MARGTMGDDFKLPVGPEKSPCGDFTWNNEVLLLREAFLNLKDIDNYRNAPRWIRLLKLT
jgi:hypothetical protein